MRWARDEAFWSWHTVTVHDTEDGRVVLDYVQWPGPGIGPRPAAPGGAPHGLARAVLDPAAGSVRRELLDDARVELPRVDDRVLTRPYRRAAVAAGSGRTEGLLPGEYDAVRWYDLRDGGVTGETWVAGDLSLGEAVLAPVPGTSDPDHGYWLTYATDRTDGTGWLLVLPGANPSDGPLARVPLGLHGTWLPTEE